MPRVTDMLEWSKAVERAIYGRKTADGKRPETDAEQLRVVADMLDKIDDATDQLLQVDDDTRRVGRDVQADLRRIADKLDHFPISPEEEEVVGRPSDYDWNDALHK